MDNLKEYTHQEFWQVFNDRFKNNIDFAAAFNQVAAWKKVYYDLRWGYSTAHVVVRHLINENKFKVEIYIEDKKKTGLYEALESHKEDIKQYLEVPVVFTPAKVKGDKTEPLARIIYVEKLGIKEKADDDYWNEQIDWIQSMSLKLKNVVERFGNKKVPSSKQQSDGFFPTLDEYNPKITAEEYKRIFSDTQLVSPTWLDILFYLYQMDGVGSCKQIAKKYGNIASHYNTNGINIAKAVAKETGCELYSGDTDKNKYWPVLFFGKDIVNNPDEGIFLYKVREPVLEAIKALDEGGFFEFMKNDMEPKEDKIPFDKNMILYGPPGTGKTYNTAIYAMAICDNLSIEHVSAMPYAEVMERYRELRDVEKRVAFTTFHQSYGYEEFIEGIKPVMDGDGTELAYTTKAGVFKKFCEDAKNPLNIEIDHNAQVWIVRLNGTKSSDLKTECFNDGCIRFDLSKPSLDADYMKLLQQINAGDYVVSYCEKSKYIDAIGVVSDDETFSDDSKSSFKWTRKVNWLVKNIHVDIKAMNGDTWLPNCEIAHLKRMKVSDLLKVVADNGGYAGEKNDNRYVFIIDEINRGNISKIFGELITLIEDTKREGKEEAASAILPYSGESFSVPQNVYIIGTMNTADRSIALMDTALRRRFNFIEMMPNPQILRKLNADKVEKDGKVLDVANMLETINQRIEYMYDREHTIGHAFFTGLKDEPTIEKLANIFEKSVMPLLQEYFYEDYSKIMMILGDNGKKNDADKFIIAKETAANVIFKGDVSDVDIPDYAYEIQKDAFRNIMSYIEV